MFGPFWFPPNSAYRSQLLSNVASHNISIYSNLKPSHMCGKEMVKHTNKAFLQYDHTGSEKKKKPNLSPSLAELYSRYIRIMLETNGHCRDMWSLRSRSCDHVTLVKPQDSWPGNSHSCIGTTGKIPSGWYGLGGEMRLGGPLCFPLTILSWKMVMVAQWKWW